MTQKKKLIILGAGISGLSLAFWLFKYRKDEFDVTLLEEKPKAGGWITSCSDQSFFFERGPRSLRPSDDTLQLIEEIGLQGEVIVPPKAAKKRYLYCQAALHPLPHSLMTVFTSPLFRGLKKVNILKGMFSSPQSFCDESIEDFFKKRFSQEFVERFIDPLVSGIFAGDKSKLSMESCFPKVFESAKKGSFVRSAFCSSISKNVSSPWFLNLKRSPLFSFRTGIGRLTEMLQEKLPYPIHFGEKVLKVTLEGAIQTEKHTFNSECVVSTMPWIKLQSIIKLCDPETSEMLKQLPFASVKQVHLGYKKSGLLPKGFGYLIPSQERSNILGAVFDSEIFHEHNTSLDETRLTVMLGGTLHPDVVDWSVQKTIDISIETISSHLKIKADPLCALVTSCPNAIAQYPVGFQTLIHKIQDRLSHTLPGWHLLGSSSHGVGINDCISASKQLAVRL